MDKHLQTGFNRPLFAIGFRPFFIMAGGAALALMLLWNALQRGQLSLIEYYGASLWHGHEMLLGFTSAVIAGFLLTAVRHWSGQSTVSGPGLSALVLLWLYGRILPFYTGLLPDGFIALVEFSFLPALAYATLPQLWRSSHGLALALTALLASLIISNGWIHASVLELTESVATGVNLAVATLIVLILVVAGKVMPFFTERGAGTVAIRNPVWDIASITGAVLSFALLLFGMGGWFLTLVAALTVAVNGLRLIDWYTPKIWYLPLLWVLYLGYGWLIAGFALIAVAGITDISQSLIIHCFTVGGIGVITLGMMARVSLGHTGRPLKAPKIISAAFIALNLAVLIRAFAPIAAPALYDLCLYWAALAWLLAFALFVGYYTPMLLAPRIDAQRD
ncbi:MAG: NnrS family protein [Methylococcales bacterium]|nr:NnrS family protein [Methylococcales bacterium]